MTVIGELTAGPALIPESASTLPASLRAALRALRLALTDHAEAIHRQDFPSLGLDLLRRSGFWGAGLPAHFGGLALEGEHILRLMRLVGRASLPLGRLFEGHVNALALVSAYGSSAQKERIAAEVEGGHLFGVWNTEGPDGVRLSEQAGILSLQGAKTFASGGRNVLRPLLPVEGPGGRQLVLLRADDPHSRVSEVPESWRPLGMEATHSVKLDFTGSLVRPGDLIGQPGDYYRQPMFSVGALRFCAVQLGGADALLEETRHYLHALGRAGDEVQQLRFAGVWQALQAASLSVAEGARLEEVCTRAPELEPRLLAQVDAARLATEDACLALLEACERAVGARGLMEPQPFPRLICDLRMYLRQPAPDAARLRLGRWVLEGGPVDAEDAEASGTGTGQREGLDG